MIDQQAQAEMFARQFAEGVQAATSVVLDRAREFLNGAAVGVLKEQVRIAALTAAENSQVGELMQILRPQAALFANTSQSENYWGIIDATNVLMDATGTRWPFMTMERRRIYLSWVIPTAQQVH